MMPPRRSSLVLVLLAFGLVFAATAQQEAPPTPEFPTLPEDAPAGTGMMRPCLEPFGGVRCGRYRVYEDREAHSGRTIDLAFVVADALEPEPKTADATVLFFGGPGEPTTPAAGAILGALPELRRHRDLLLIDHRGTGASQALDCAIPFPGGVASRFESLFPKDFVVACRDRLSERADLSMYTSAHTMDDLDELRGWLNYGALNLVGGSYGTLETQVYLRRHPESARIAVLNAVVPTFAPGYVTHARGLQDALDGLLAECAGQDACATAYPELGETVRRVLDRVRTDPPRVTAEGETVTVTPGALGYAIRGLLYGRAGEVPALLTRAEAGDWQPLVDYYLERSGWVQEEGGIIGMHLSVVCAEDVSRDDAVSIAEWTEGTFLGDWLIGSYRSACDLWPYARLDPSFWEPVESEVPTLLLSGARDPVTPPSGGEAVARHLSRSLHVVVPDTGHGAGGACYFDILNRFLDAGTVEGLDVSCLQAPPPTEFVLPDEG